MTRVLQIIAIFMLLLFGYYYGFMDRPSRKISHYTQSDVKDSYIEITGNEAFIKQTTDALTLLQEKAPEAFSKVQKYIGVIKQGRHSAMWAYKKPPRFEVNDRTAFSSTTWYASVIAHESLHSELYHNYKNNHNSKVPDYIWKEREAEILSIKHQLAVAKKLGSPQHEINQILAQSTDGTHADIDKDGDVDWIDYLKRNW